MDLRLETDWAGASLRSMHLPPRHVVIKNVLNLSVSYPQINYSCSKFTLTSIISFNSLSSQPTDFKKLEMGDALFG